MWRYTPLRVSLGRRVLLAGEPGESGIIRNAEHSAHRDRRHALKGHARHAMRRVAACFVLLVGLLALTGTTTSACATTPLARTGARECSTSADCSAGETCLFSVFLSCDNPGSCLAATDAQACVPQTACNCHNVTESVCLVGGNSPSRMLSLGSCDGATQQGYDASTTSLVDSSGTGTGTDTDAADTSLPEPPADSGPPVPDATTEVDAADSAPPPSTLGTSCTTSTECTDPIYNLCERVSGNTKICTANCFVDGNCQPPVNGVCDQNVDLCTLQ